MEYFLPFASLLIIPICEILHFLFRLHLPEAEAAAPRNTTPYNNNRNNRINSLLDNCKTLKTISILTFLKITFAYLFPEISQVIVTFFFQKVE